MRVMIVDAVCWRENIRTCAQMTLCTYVRTHDVPYVQTCAMHMPHYGRKETPNRGTSTGNTLVPVIRTVGSRGMNTDTSSNLETIPF